MTGHDNYYLERILTFFFFRLSSDDLVIFSISTKRVDESKRVVNACKRVKTSGKRVETSGKLVKTTGKRMETIDIQ